MSKKIESKSDAITVYNNSGLIDLEHGHNQFDENEFCDFLYLNNHLNKIHAMIKYLAKKNNKTEKEIIFEYDF